MPLNGLPLSAGLHLRGLLDALHLLIQGICLRFDDLSHLLLLCDCSLEPLLLLVRMVLLHKCLLLGFEYASLDCPELLPHVLVPDQFGTGLREFLQML